MAEVPLLRKGEWGLWVLGLDSECFSMSIEGTIDSGFIDMTIVGMTGLGAIGTYLCVCKSEIRM